MTTSETPGFSPEQTTATAPQQPPRRRGRLGRRALVGAAALSVCAAGGLALAPTAEKLAQEATQKAIDEAYAAGINAGRQALLSELAQLEGVSIDAALEVATITKLAVLYIVRPVAQLLATITGDALGGLIAALGAAQSRLASINVHISQLDQLKALLTQWQQNVRQLPISLTQYATTDIDSAESYLMTLKRQIQDSK